MNAHAERTPENKNHLVTNQTVQKMSGGNSTFQFADNRAETITQRKLQTLANSNSENPIQKQGVEEEELLQGKFNTIQKQGLEEEELLHGKFETAQMVEEGEELLQGKFNPVQRVEEEEELLQGKFITVQKQEIEEEELMQGKFATIQKKENNTGLPDNLKSGIENLSGHSLDDVKVHYNSDKPAQLNAHAYAQGTDIHLGSGQEKHLPHEAWHVVQQKQGRVKPTMQMKGKVNVNDDVGLEKEADVKGAKATQLVDSRPEAIAQRKLQEMANNSPQASTTSIQLKAEQVAQMNGKKKPKGNKKAQSKANTKKQKGKQHHARPEYAERDARALELIRQGVSRGEARRQANEEMQNSR